MSCADVTLPRASKLYYIELDKIGQVKQKEKLTKHKDILKNKKAFVITFIWVYM